MSRESGGPYTEVARSEKPTAVAEKLEGGPPYFFVVRSVVEGEESADSEEVVAKG